VNNCIQAVILVSTMGTRGHGQEGALAPLEIVFLCISSYSKTLSRWIIYALFSQLVICFWVQSPQTPPFLDPAGWLLYPDP